MTKSSAKSIRIYSYFLLFLLFFLFNLFKGVENIFSLRNIINEALCKAENDVKVENDSKM